MAELNLNFWHPDVDRFLLTAEGEVVVDEVIKHPMAYAGPLSFVLLAAPLFITMIWTGPMFWVPMFLGLASLVHGLIGIHREHMDRFVITNMRVFRVSGILTQNIATMPMIRILDISMTQTFWGRLLGYGHFIFESAAQDQGLRDIRYVPEPNKRDLQIQQVIQLAGLRAKAEVMRVSSD
ncbi:MAG: membrane-flanked domain protein [Propionibacteriales bacterium]|nr:MAG: membrane-flanked domain protein [Propionibacteriales bacterium]